MKKVLEKAIEIFGSEELANEWLQRHNRGLNQKPIELLDNENGIQLVLDTLGRIEHGIVG